MEETPLVARQEAERPRRLRNAVSLSLLLAALALVATVARGGVPAAGATAGSSAASASSFSEATVARAATAPSTMTPTTREASASSTVTTTIVVQTNTSAEMVLHAYVTVTLTGASSDVAYAVALEYAPANATDAERLAPLWTPSATLVTADDDGTLSATITVTRLRPAQLYSFRAYVSEGGAAASLGASADATVPRIGVPRFDERPLATIAGEGLPEWALLSLLYQVTTNSSKHDEFTGIVAIDQAGWVVWCVGARRTCICIFIHIDRRGLGRAGGDEQQQRSENLLSSLPIVTSRDVCRRHRTAHTAPPLVRRSARSARSASSAFPNQERHTNRQHLTTPTPPHEACPSSLHRRPRRVVVWPRPSLLLAQGTTAPRTRSTAGCPQCGTFCPRPRTIRWSCSRLGLGS